jgi:hypothetical protein
MLEAAAIVLLITGVMGAVLAAAFTRSLESEAPHLYERLGGKALGSFSGRTRLLLPLVPMILTHKYRKELAAYPKSRAWASWLFANGWLQLGAFVVLVAAVLGK